MKLPRRHSSSPTTAVLQMHGIEPALDAWLAFNGVSDVYDAELLEVIPDEFRDEYNDRLRLNSHYERKFAEQTAMNQAGEARTGSKRCVSMERGV
jgi:hypothetical protein